MMPSPWLPVILTACGISLTILSIVAIPFVKALIAWNVTLTRFEDTIKMHSESISEVKKSHEEFREDFGAHVEADRKSFDSVAKSSSAIRAAVGGLHARLLTVQENLGIIHHDPIMIGLEEPER